MYTVYKPLFFFSISQFGKHIPFFNVSNGFYRQLSASLNIHTITVSTTLALWHSRWQFLCRTIQCWYSCRFLSTRKTQAEVLAYFNIYIPIRFLAGCHNQSFFFYQFFVGRCRLCLHSHNRNVRKYAHGVGFVYLIMVKYHTETETIWPLVFWR